MPLEKGENNDHSTSGRTSFLSCFILIVHDRIGAIGAIASPGEIHISGTKVQEIDVSKKIIIPGFIDSHF